MLKCREFVNDANLLTNDQPWQKKLSIKFHLLICSNCRRYIRHLKALIQAIPFMYNKASDDEVALVIAAIQSDTK